MSRKKPTLNCVYWIALSLALASTANAAGPSLPCPRSPEFQLQQQLAQEACDAAHRERGDLFDWERGQSAFSPAQLTSNTLRCFQGLGSSIGEGALGIGNLAKGLFYDLPKWELEQAKTSLGMLAQWAKSKLQGGTAAADANARLIAAQRDRMTQIRDSLTEFARVGLPQMLRSLWPEFACLDPALQARAICKMDMDLFLLVVSPAKIGEVSGISARIAAKAEKLVTTLKSASEFSLAQAGGRALSDFAGRFTSQGWRVTQALTSTPTYRLFRAENKAGQEFLVMERQILGKDGKMHWIADKLGEDAATGAIDGRTELGREFLERISQHGDKDTALAIVFIDVNHLGKVNYFPGGSKAGDLYLKAVADAIKSSVRETDGVFRVKDAHTFRHGGDELVLHLKDVKPDQVRKIQQRIIDAVDKDPKVRAMFQQAKAAVGEPIKRLRNAGTLAEVESAAGRPLSAAEKTLGHKDLRALKQALLQDPTVHPEVKTKLLELASIQPSIAPGAAMIHHGETAEAALARADEIAGKVKVEYKKEIGADISKYGSETANSLLSRNLKAKPVARLPSEHPTH